MVYTGIIVTEAEIALMAGELVDETGNTEANHNILAAQAQAYLSTLVKYDIVTNWGSLSSIYKSLFSEWAARYAAMTLISYNMSSVGVTFSSLIEPEDMIQVHIYRMGEIENLLKDESFQDFLGVN